MNGDYVRIEHVENGFVVILNEYANMTKSDGKQQRLRMVARNEVELYEIIKRMFPETKQIEEGNQHGP